MRECQTIHADILVRLRVENLTLSIREAGASAEPQQPPGFPGLVICPCAHPLWSEQTRSDLGKRCLCPL